MSVRLAAVLVALVSCTTSSSDGLVAPPGREDAPSTGPAPATDPDLPADADADPKGGAGREAGSPSDAGRSTATDASSSGGDPYEAARKACVAAVNQYRGTLGRAPLARYAAKEACADAQASADASQNVDHYAYLHGAPSCLEDNVVDRQNECPRWYGPPAKAAADCVAKMFAEGPGTGAAHGHYTTMMNAQYTRLSCGVRVVPGGPAGADTWVVLNFY